MVHKVTYLLTYSLTCLLTYLFTHSLTYLLTYLFTHLLVHSLTHLLVHSLTHSLTYLLTYLFTHLLVHSLTHLLTYFYLLTMQHNPYREVKPFSASQEIPAFYGIRKFITAFTSARHLSLSWASSIQSKPPHPISWRSILILYSHLYLVLPSGLFRSGFPAITLYDPILSPNMLHATCPAHHILLDFITRIKFGAVYRSLSYYWTWEG